MKWKAEENAEVSCVRFSRDETAVYTVGTGGEVSSLLFFYTSVMKW